MVVILDEVDSAILGESHEGLDTMDIMVWCIVHHRYHLHSVIVMGGERYLSFLFSLGLATEVPKLTHYGVV